MVPVKTYTMTYLVFHLLQNDPNEAFIISMKDFQRALMISTNEMYCYRAPKGPVETYQFKRPAVFKRNLRGLCYLKGPKGACNGIQNDLCYLNTI